MAADAKTNFLIKGFKDGLLISIKDNDWRSFKYDLLAHIDEQSTFFRGAKVALQVGSEPLSVSEISQLRGQLHDREVILWALISDDEHTKSTAKNLGLETSLPSKQVEQKVEPFDTEILGEDAIFLRKTLRSGYRVMNRGHVIILGDVNPGAEIIAGGSVIIWGRLRGVVHAGAEGDEQAVICALDLAPTQLRIAAIVSITPSRKGKPQPEIVSIQNGQLVAESWKV